MCVPTRLHARPPLHVSQQTQQQRTRPPFRRKSYQLPEELRIQAAILAVITLVFMRVPAACQAHMQHRRLVRSAAGDSPAATAVPLAMAPITASGSLVDMSPQASAASMASARVKEAAHHHLWHASERSYNDLSKVQVTISRMECLWTSRAAS